jgi:hypothetical protein
LVLVAVLVACVLVGAPRAVAPREGAPQAVAPVHTVPNRLSDREFWRLVTELSEPGGHFPSDNLVSNEVTFQWVIPELQQRWTDGRAYLGVGPDQNFTYLAALDPSIAFIVDIRRDNLRLQLMYKALFELSPTRASFLSKLFSREGPRIVNNEATVSELMSAFQLVAASDELFRDTLKSIRDHLSVQHGFALTADDYAGIEFVLSAFRYAGPSLRYANTGNMARYPTYRELMEATDQLGAPRGYLSSEKLYGRLRSLQLRNLVVPIVGDFAGTTALRQVGEYLRTHRAVVGTIYTSNVEQYLFQYSTWRAYYANVATLPVDEGSTFVRSCFNSCGTTLRSRSVQLVDSVAALLRDVTGGRIQSYYDVLVHR